MVNGVVDSLLHKYYRCYLDVEEPNILVAQILRYLVLQSPLRTIWEHPLSQVNWIDLYANTDGYYMIWIWYRYKCRHIYIYIYRDIYTTLRHQIRNTARGSKAVPPHGLRIMQVRAIHHKLLHRQLFSTGGRRQRRWELLLRDARLPDGFTVGFCLGCCFCSLKLHFVCLCFPFPLLQGVLKNLLKILV